MQNLSFHRSVVFIYALLDPETMEVRYIGKTYNLNKRFREHCNSLRPSHKTSWIQSIKRLGKLPLLEVIECIDDPHEQHWQSREVFWIEWFIKEGYRLTNLDGGGLSGTRPSAESRAKMSAKRRGIQKPSHIRAILSESNRKRIWSDVSREKLRQSNLGKTMKPETIKKIVASMKGKTHSKETKLKQSESLKKYHAIHRNQ